MVWGAAARAHDAPARVAVQLHLRPAAGVLHVMARIPLEAVRDVDFPAAGDGYLDVVRLAPQLPGLAKIWVADPLELYENGVRTGAARVVGTQLSLPADRSFASFDEARAHLQTPFPANSERLVWKQLFFDVALEIPVRDQHAAFSVRAAFANLGESVQTVLHYRQRTLLLTGGEEVFPLEPTWLQAARMFVRLGFVHILRGVDHLLFLLCLVLATRRFGELVWVVTAFTAAHSITLIASSLGWAPAGLWFPPFVELAIAISIVYLALANIVGAAGHGSRWLAFGFGLVHGFGFSFALRESMQFAGAHLAAALLSFNVGVELGQLAALVVMVPALTLLFRRAVPERLGVMAISALVAHTGWHWMWERGELLSKYSFTVAFDAASGAILLRWVMALMAAGGVAWAIRRRRGAQLEKR